MPDLAPFRGVRYAPDRVPPGLGISPPYDAIDRELHRSLLEANRYNSVRWTLGDDPDAPGGSREEFEARGKRFRAWLADGVLVRDPTPCLYRYTMEYRSDDGEAFEYRGLLGLVKTAPWREGGIHPHEQIRPQVMEERLRLLEASRVDMGVIHLVTRAPGDGFVHELTSAAGALLFDGVDFRGHRHRLESIGEPTAIARLIDRVASLPCVVADGHHRYTTFQEGVQRGLSGSDWALVAISDLDQPGVRIRATHRLVLWPEDPAADLERTLGGNLGEASGVSWGVVRKGGKSTVLRTRLDLESPTLTERVRQLIPVPRVENHHDPDRALARLSDWRGSGLLCRLPAVTKDELWLRPLKRQEVFPSKTTWFEPKIPTGVVARLLERDS